ncbi:hypothetical protein Cgig2_012518 [Carnegiea gigantea]|uniref:DUF7795 domain-containing protein n=1 Tax=Carnegiea gigantea TaxID=171969 RepID=A0A9Q1GZR5_9CARY|nr:hypothetical protein Cgig2_012518 [Carnegiea gigantea]
MELEEGKSSCNPNHELRKMLSEFLAEVVKLEELGSIGGRFLIGFQQALEFLRRPSIFESSEFDHLTKAKNIIEELEKLMEKAGSVMQSVDEMGGDECEMDFGVESEPVTSDECGSFMAVIYSMMKQDYVMQERIVSALNLKTPAGELDAYCMMWSLRPFVDDDVVHQGLRLVR